MFNVSGLQTYVFRYIDPISLKLKYAFWPQKVAQMSDKNETFHRKKYICSIGKCYYKKLSTYYGSENGTLKK